MSVELVIIIILIVYGAIVTYLYDNRGASTESNNDDIINELDRQHKLLLKTASLCDDFVKIFDKLQESEVKGINHILNHYPDDPDEDILNAINTMISERTSLSEEISKLTTEFEEDVKKSTKD